MQTSVPEVTDLSDEPDSIFEMYGENSRDPGSYAANCLLGRRLLEIRSEVLSYGETDDFS